MIANLYQGNHAICTDTNPYYLQYFNEGVDASKIMDESGAPMKFVKKEKLSGEIQRWSPFYAHYKQYDGTTRRVGFVCPECGFRSCNRPNTLFDDPHFFQGDYECSNCKSDVYNFYSDCWVDEKENKNEQLILF